MRIAAVLLLAAAVSFAQSGSVRTEVDARKIGVDDIVTLSIVLEGDAASLEAGLPMLKNLKVVGGPSTSTQISFVNGSMSRQKVLSFVMKAEKTGPAEVGPVSVQGHAPTAPISIEVVAGAIRPAEPQDPFGRDPFGGRDPFEEIFGRPQRRQPTAQGKLFVEANLSRPIARVGEPVLVTYYVYTQISLSGVEFAEAPKYPGFWAEEIERGGGNDSSGTNVAIQGEPYLRYPVLERLLFPTKTGTLEIPEARLRLVPSGGMFGVAAPIERSTKALRVKVDPLPSGAPEGGVVGSYEVDATTDRTSLSLGDALTFRFKATGRGNLKWIDATPKLEIPNTRIFPPRVTSDLKTTRQGIDGSKTWEFVIVPEREGTIEIPSLAFPHFDPQTGAVRMPRTPTIPIAVSAASGPAPAAKSVPTSVALRADLDEPQRDLSRPATALAVIAMVAQVVGWRRRSARVLGPTRNASAIASALREIQSESLLGGTKERAATRIAEAVESVFGPRKEWPADDLGDRLRSLADDLEFLRFAPQLGSYDAKLREVRDRAVSILETLR